MVTRCCCPVAPPPARRWTDSTGWTGHSTQRSTYASPTAASPTSDAMTATEVIRFACLSSHSSPSDTSGRRATARRRSPAIPRNRHPRRVATPKNTSAGTISRRAPPPAGLLASSSDASSHGFARSRVDDSPCRRDEGEQPVALPEWLECLQHGVVAVVAADDALAVEHLHIARRPGARRLVGPHPGREPLAWGGPAGELEQPRRVDLLDPMAVRSSDAVRQCGQLLAPRLGVSPPGVATRGEQLPIDFESDFEDHPTLVD